MSPPPPCRRPPKRRYRGRPSPAVPAGQRRPPTSQTPQRPNPSPSARALPVATVNRERTLVNDSTRVNDPRPFVLEPSQRLTFQKDAPGVEDG